MVQVCEGLKTKNDMLVENIEMYKEMYIKTKRDMNRIVAVRPVIAFYSTTDSRVVTTECGQPPTRPRGRLRSRVP